MVDLRTQRGVGADAIDSLKRFYELKVYAGSEPDSISLTPSEVQRAATPEFFLVVVSQVEAGTGKPTVRVIVDPLHQLQVSPSGAITLTGVRSSHGIVYEFMPA